MQSSETLFFSLLQCCKTKRSKWTNLDHNAQHVDSFIALTCIWLDLSVPTTMSTQKWLDTEYITDVNTNNPHCNVHLQTCNALYKMILSHLFCSVMLPEGWLAWHFFMLKGNAWSLHAVFMCRRRQITQRSLWPEPCLRNDQWNPHITYNCRSNAEI